MLKRCWILCSLCFFISPWLCAQAPFPRTHNKWEFSFFFGSSGIQEKTIATPVEGGGTQDVGLALESDYVVGVRVTENLGQHFGAELEYALANHPGSFRNLSSLIPRLDFDQKIHKIAYSVLFYPFPRDSRFRPFGSVGIGASFFDLDVSRDSEIALLEQGVDLNSRWQFAGTYGGGLKVQLGPRWGVRVTIRDHITDVPNYGLPPLAAVFDGQTGPAFRPDGENFHNWQITGGLMYTFGSR